MQAKISIFLKFPKKIIKSQKNTMTFEVNSVGVTLHHHGVFFGAEHIISVEPLKNG